MGQILGRVLILTALTMGVWMYLVRHSARNEGRSDACRVGYVYDGDTVELRCGEDRHTARIVGLDTPETRDARCDAELVHGKKATARLRVLVAGGEVRYLRRGYDKYGRMLIRLTIDKVDVAKTLVNEGLAVRYNGGSRINWCRKLETT